MMILLLVLLLMVMQLPAPMPHRLNAFRLLAHDLTAITCRSPALLLVIDDYRLLLNAAACPRPCR